MSDQRQQELGLRDESLIERNHRTMAELCDVQERAEKLSLELEAVLPSHFVGGGASMDGSFFSRLNSLALTRTIALTPTIALTRTSLVGRWGPGSLWSGL